MNKVFKVVWSKVRNAYVVVSEIAKNTVSGVGKRNRVNRFSLGATLAAAALTSSFFLPNEGLAAESALVNANFYNYIAIAATYQNGSLVNPFGNGTTITTDGSERYIEVTVGNNTYKYVYTMVDQDGVFDNNTADDKAYWIRDGFGVKAITERYHPSATDVKLDLYKVPGTNATYDNISMSGAHTAEITSAKTAVNNTALDKFVFIQYAAMTNAGGIDTPSEWNYYINRVVNGQEQYIDVGGNNFGNNFYEFKAGEFNAITGKYTFKGQDVEYENVYKVGGKIGVFLTNSAYNASYRNITSSDLPNNVGVYGGAVYGANNEILLSGYDSEANTWSTVWAGEVTDPYATVDSMTLSEFNEILEHLHKEDVKLANADIVGIKAIAGSGLNSGTLKLVNQSNNLTNGLTITSSGGTGGDDTKLTFNGSGTYVDANGNTQEYNNSFILGTGSKVVANNGIAYTTNQQLTSLTINGNMYSVTSGGNNSGTTVVSNITLTEGDNIDIVGTTSNNVTNYVITAVDKDTKYTVVNGVKDNATGNTVYTIKDDKDNTIGHITDTDTDTNTLYVVKDGVKDDTTGNTTYKVESSSGNEYSIIDTNNYVTNASVVGSNLVLERVGLDDITVSLAALRDGLATADMKLIPNPDDSSNGKYTVDPNGNIMLKVSDGTNTSDVVININKVKTEVIGSGNVSVVPSTGSDGHTIYTVSATDNNTTYEVEDITASSNLVGGQKAKYQIKDKVTGDDIGTIIDHDATLTNQSASKTPSSDGTTNTYRIVDSAGNYTTLEDVASGEKLQSVVTNVNNILNGDVLKLGVDSNRIALINNANTVLSDVAITSATGTGGNDATLTFDSEKYSFSVNVGSTVSATNYGTTGTGTDTIRLLKGLSINGIPYTIEDTKLDRATKSNEIKDGSYVVGWDYTIYDTSQKHVVLDDLASAEYVKDSFASVKQMIDNKRTEVQAGNNVIVSDPVVGADGNFIYTINAKDTTYSIIESGSNLTAGQKTKYEIKNNLTNDIETIVDTDTTYEVNTITLDLSSGQKTKYEIKDKVTNGVIGTIIDNYATLKNQSAEKESTSEYIDTYKIMDTANNWTTIDVPSVAKLQKVVDDITQINTKISGAAGSLSVTNVSDDTNTANQKELGKINLLQGNDVKSSIDVAVSHGDDTEDVVVSFNNGGVALNITTGSIVKGTAVENKLTHLSINGHNYELFNSDSVATYNNINIVDLGSSSGTGTDRHGWSIQDSNKTDPNHNGATYNFKDTTLDQPTSNNKTEVKSYGYKYHIVDTAGNDIVLADVASANKLNEVAVRVGNNEGNISKILNGTAFKLGVDDINNIIALLNEGNSAMSTVKVTSSITDDANDATLIFTDKDNKQFSVKVGSTVRVSADNNKVLNGLTINGNPYTIKDTTLDCSKSTASASQITNASGVKIGNDYVVWDTSGNKVDISDVASADYVKSLAEVVASKTSRDVKVESIDSNIEVAHTQDNNSVDVTYNLKLADNVHINNSLSVGDNVDISANNGEILANIIKANNSVQVGNVKITSSDITGLTNRTWSSTGTYDSGRAATEEQLQQAISYVQSGAVASDKYVVSGKANGTNQSGKIVLSMHNSTDIEIDGLEDYAIEKQGVTVDTNGVATLRVTDRYDGNKYYDVTINDIAKASDVGDINTITVGGNGGTTTPTTIVSHINNLYNQVNTISATNSDWRLVGAYDNTTKDYGYDNKYTVGDNHTISLNMQDKNDAGNEVKQVVIENVAKASDIGDINQITHNLATDTTNNVVNHINNLYSQVSAEVAKDTSVASGDGNIVVTSAMNGEDTVYKVSLASDVSVNNSITVGTGANQVVLNGTNASVSAHSVTATTIKAGSNFIVGDTRVTDGGVYGLDNVHWDSTTQYTGGRAATQEQLQEAINDVKGNLDTQINTIAGEKVIGGVNQYNGIITLNKDNGGIATITGIENHALAAHASKDDAIKADSDGIVELVTVDKYNSNSKHSTYIADVASKEKLDGLTGAVGATDKESVKESYEKTTFLKETETLTDADVKLDEAVTNVAVNSYNNDVALQNIITNNSQYLDSRINQLGSRVNKVGAGAAALAALHPMDFDPDDKLSFAVGAGNYAGENATALGAFYRPNEKVMMSVGGTYGNGENMVNMGVSFALDRTNNVSNSRTAMAREIVDLREQVATQGQQIAQLVALVQQLAGVQQHVVPTEQLFPDVPQNHWAYEYVNGLVAKGIIEGYPDGTFGGDRVMTRYEFAAMLFRAMEQGIVLNEQIRQEFEPELGRIRVDRVKGTDADLNKIERVRVNTAVNRDDYGTKVVQVKH